MAPLLLAVVVLLLRHLYYRLHLRLPPGPRPWPVVGNLYQIKSVRFRRFAEWAQSHGPIISVWEGSTLNVVVSTSELARQVLKDNDRHLADRYRSRAAAKLAGSGQGLIWADYGPHYVTARKVTAALLSAKSLESLRPIREDEVTAMVESIYTQCRSRSMQLEKYLRAVAFNNITRMAFGKRGVGRRGDEGYHGGASAEAPSHRRACAVAAVDVPAPRPCTRRACCSEGPPHAADNHRPQPPKRRSKAAFLQHFAHR